ncbi:MAG: hypothetical protein M2R45_03038 [Verrucomicrobia subdivision 3 bacterium]|nr:hypothetical protein [Limisphaerales bacterium]MCS1415558.1 hypothetical protein [Limisphaerales bacterium]
MNPQSFADLTEKCCGNSMNRRSFLKSTALPFGIATLGGTPKIQIIGEETVSPSADSESLVTFLYKSLSDLQREMICMSFDHKKRSQVENNWHITKARVGEHFTPDQQDLIKQIFLSLHSPEYREAVFEQVAWDTDEEGLEDCSIALFGKPGVGKFEFVLTGRHVTRRCDGDSLEGSAFGGPIFYGHQAGKYFDEPANHPGNAYWYQAKRANEVFQMLDGKQRDLALLNKPRKEEGTKTVKLTGRTSDLPGIPIEGLSGDQKEHVRKVLADVLAPFRKKDATEALNLIEPAQFDHLHMAFYKHNDIGNDGVWDVWQIEGPSALIFFRGEPHVHAYIHIRKEPIA